MLGSVWKMMCLTWRRLWHTGRPNRLAAIISLSVYRTLCSVTVWLSYQEVEFISYHIDSALFLWLVLTNRIQHKWCANSEPITLEQFHSWKLAQSPLIWLPKWMMRDTWPYCPHHASQWPANPLKQSHRCMIKPGQAQKTTSLSPGQIAKSQNL